MYVCAVLWKVRVCVWRRLATRLTRLGVWKGVERRTSPYRLKNYGYNAIIVNLVHSFEKFWRSRMTGSYCKGDVIAIIVVIQLSCVCLYPRWSWVVCSYCIMCVIVFFILEKTIMLFIHDILFFSCLTALTIHNKLNKLLYVIFMFFIIRREGTSNLVRYIAIRCGSFRSFDFLF